MSIGGNSTTKNLDCKGVIMSLRLFEVAKTDVSTCAVLVLLCFVSDTIPVSIRFRSIAWSLVDILSISSIRRYLGLFKNKQSMSPDFVVLAPSTKQELFSLLKDSKNIVLAMQGGLKEVYDFAHRNPNPS